jgi:4-amino-4-deoxy-L-arabinose transferase-like glycosyltransferase
MAHLQTHEQLESAERRRMVSRSEFALMIGIVFLAASLRFAFPARMAIEHFDEGVYASNIWFAESADYRYPARHLYAPPLLPAIIEWSIILFGTGSVSVMLVSLVAGTATIVAVWWVARRWFGAESGIAAASLAALSDYHILYSRAALTDVLMCLWLLIAVGCVHEAFARGRHLWGIAAGLATGLAWSTKHNGWLPLAIAASGLVLYALVSRWKKKSMAESWTDSLISLAAMALTAAVVWSPVWFDLDERGGYAAVAANHSGYFGGLSNWLPTLSQQIGNHRHLDGWLGCAAMGLAVITAIVLRHWTVCGFTWNETEASKSKSASEPKQNSTAGRTDWRALTGLALLTMTSAMFLGSSVTVGVLAVAAIGVHLFRRLTHNESTLPFCLLAVWFCGLSVATPFYCPYPRLTLPWLIAAWLGGGAMIGAVVRKFVGSDDGNGTGMRRSSGWILVGSAILFSGAIYLNLDRWTERGIPGWQSRTGLQEVAADIAAQVNSASPDGDVLILVYAEPGLFFQLATVSNSRWTATPIGTLQPSTRSPVVPTYLVTGPNAHREPGHTVAIARYGDRLQRVAGYPYPPSDLVLLNWFSPSSPAFPGPKQRVQLYRLR